MQNKSTALTLSIRLLILLLVLCACSIFTPAPTPANTPKPTETNTATPTIGPTFTATPRPTATPNLAATQKYADFNKEVQSYFDSGYLASTDGTIKEIDDFEDDWAQIGWYRWLPMNRDVSDFFMSAHFKWMSASQSADESGCGFAFAINDFGNYAVFLDRNKVIFLDADSSYGSYSGPVGRTRGSGRVKISNPPEADFTLIVNGISAYVLVNHEFIGQYTLSKSRILRGDLGLTVLSGTNKGYGTHCEMTNIHLFAPK